jgi:hypothetical protein
MMMLPLVQVVVAQGVGFGVHGLVAVGVFSQYRAKAEHCQGEY